MDDEYIAQLAQEWKYGLRFLEKDIVFYTEDIADVKFWSHIFAAFVPQLKIDFRYYTHSPEGVIHTGKGMALRYVPYLDRLLMLCLDSDYDYIISTPDFNIQHYIFQTYTYSIENYKCYAPSLTALCKEGAAVTDDIAFNMESFLTQYSKIIYPLLVYAIANEFRGFGFDMPDFNAVSRLKGAFNPVNNGEAELQFLKEQVNQKMAQLMLLCSQEDFDNARQALQEKGIKEENTYLFMRGHSLLDSVAKPLLKSITENIKAKIINELREQNKPHGIQNYLTACKPIRELLDNNFNFFDCEVFEKIKRDILSIA